MSEQDQLIVKAKLKYYREQEEQLQKSIISVARLQERLSYMTASYLPHTSRVNVNELRTN